MKTKTITLAFIMLLTGCASHQYDGMRMSDSHDGTRYSIKDNTITVHYQEYQFVPNTQKVLLSCRNNSRKVAEELNLEISNFDFVTERNPALGLTSCIAFGDFKN